MTSVGGFELGYRCFANLERAECVLPDQIRFGLTSPTTTPGRSRRLDDGETASPGPRRGGGQALGVEARSGEPQDAPAGRS